MENYTKEEKHQYFKALRERWAKTKELAEKDEIKAAFLAAQMEGLNVSVSGFAWVYAQMKDQGLEGVPVIDAKTFQGWKESGFKVKKGEHSTLMGITWWINTDEKGNEGEEGDKEKPYIFPKAYHLFHRSQVEELAL